MALGVVILLTFVALKLPTRAATNLKLAISGMFLPFFGATGSTKALVEKSSYGLLSHGELIRQLELLNQTNQLLQIQFRLAVEWKRENDRLHTELGVMRQYPWKLKLARVAARDPANWWKTIRIDLGSRDGVMTNAPVLTPEGLVGRVSEVGFAQSQVALVGDPDCRVSVLVVDYDMPSMTSQNMPEKVAPGTAAPEKGADEHVKLYSLTAPNQAGPSQAGMADAAPR